MASPTKFRSKWRIRWIDHDRRRCSEVHATYNEAERALRKHEHEADEVRAGRKDPEPTDRTFGELAEYWIKFRVPLKRSGADDKSILKVHLLPSFGGLSLREIGVAEIDKFKAARPHLAKQTIRNHLTLLVTMLTLAVNLGWLRTRPKVEKPRVRICSTDYQWLQNEEETRRLLLAARDELGDLAFTFYSTAVYTGMRAGEIAGLHWNDVQLERRQITVQRSFQGPTKAEDLRRVPILDTLLPPLRAWRARTGASGLVFSNERGGMFDQSARIFQEWLHRSLARAGFPRVLRGTKLRPYIRFHDLRHTFASHWMLNGGDLFKLQKVLGHKSSEMTLRYAHLAPDAFREDYGRFGAALPLEPDGGG